MGSLFWLHPERAKVNAMSTVAIAAKSFLKAVRSKKDCARCLDRLRADLQRLDTFFIVLRGFIVFPR